MFESIFGATLGAVVGLIVYIYVFYLIYLFFKSARVHYFEYDNSVFPSFFWGVGDEKLIGYGHSVSGRFRLYLSNKRILFNKRNLIATKHSCTSIPLETVNTSEVYYRNPYWLLILAGLQILFFILSVTNSLGSSRNEESDYFSYRTHSSNNDTPVLILLIGLIIVLVILVGLWYYFRGYQIVIKNPNTTMHVLCRDRNHLLDFVHRIDQYRLALEETPQVVFDDSSILKGNGDERQSRIEKYSDKIETAIKSKMEAGKQKLHSMTAPNKGITVKGNVTYDQTCSQCQSVITLELDDLKFNTFVCPICSAVNTINKQES